MSTGLAQIIEILQCPRCRRGKLQLQSDKVSCPSCAAEFPLEDGIPNFILTDSTLFQDAPWRAAQDGYEKPFWDHQASVGQSLPATHPINKYWKSHAEVQYAKFLEFRNQAPAQSCLEIAGGRTPRIRFVPAPVKVALDPLMSRQYRAFSSAYENIVCLSAMAECLPLADNSMDYVVMSNCLDHFAKPDIALREVFRVLRPDGFVYISLETFTPLWKQWHKCFDKAHPHRWTPRDQQELIKRCGGTIVYFAVDPPEIRQWYSEIALTFRRKMAIFLRKEQSSWIFAKRA